MTRRQATNEERLQFESRVLTNRETGPCLRQHYRIDRLWRGAAEGPEAIGALNSFFTTLDGTSSMAQSGRRRFSIREAWELLSAPARQHDQDVARRVAKVRAFERRLAEPGSSPAVTVVEFTDDAVVVDGNHTAMAAYVYSAKRSTSEPLPLFVLVVPESVRVLGA